MLFHLRMMKIWQLVFHMNPYQNIINWSVRIYARDEISLNSICWTFIRTYLFAIRVYWFADPSDLRSWYPNKLTFSIQNNLFRGVIFLGGNFPGRGAIFLGGVFLGGVIFRGALFPRVFFPGAFFLVPFIWYQNISSFYQNKFVFHKS